MVIRSIVDTARARLWTPGTLWRGVRALRSLRKAAPALRWWLAAIGPREIAFDTFRADLVLMMGSDVARKPGVPAYLIDDATGIDLRWLAGARRVGIVAGASTPPRLVDAVVHALSGLGPVNVQKET
jgi:hypothetical protein